MSELKPCPFCGDEAEMCESEPSTARFNEGAVHFAVQCFGFDCQGVKANVWQITPEDAANKWNTRHDEWISVDDKLPVKSGAYWTFNGNDEKPSCIQQRVHIYDSDYKWFNSDTVTHWKLLPEPPK